MVSSTTPSPEARCPLVWLTVWRRKLLTSFASTVRSSTLSFLSPAGSVTFERSG